MGASLPPKFPTGMPSFLYGGSSPHPQVSDGYPVLSLRELLPPPPSFRRASRPFSMGASPPPPSFRRASRPFSMGAPPPSPCWVLVCLLVGLHWTLHSSVPPFLISSLQLPVDTKIILGTSRVTPSNNSLYWTVTSLQQRLINLNFKLFPVQYRENVHGLLSWIKDSTLKGFDTVSHGQKQSTSRLWEKYLRLVFTSDGVGIVVEVSAGNVWAHTTYENRCRKQSPKHAGIRVGRIRFH